MDIVEETNEERLRYVLSQTATAACKMYLSVSIQSCIVMNFILHPINNGLYILIEAISFSSRMRKEITWK